MLRLTEEEEGLWEQFQGGNKSFGAQLAKAAVYSSWARSRELGVSSEGPAHPLGVRGHELSSRKSTLAELRDATPVIEALEAEVTPRGLLSVVADADGVIIRARGGDAFRDDVKKTRLVEGVRWDEGARGTNAIGTALAERQAVAVVGRAHWEQVNHGLFCYAAPIHDPFGSLLAVLDVTGPVAHDAPEIGAAVRSAATAVAQVLRARAYTRSDAGNRGLVERMLHRCHGPAILAEAPGVVTAHNRAAAAEFALPSGPIAIEKLFGASWDELVRASFSGSTTFETKRRRFAVELEPILSEGRLLALACFFEPLVTTRPGPRIAAAVPRTRVSPAFERIFAQDDDVARAKELASKLALSDIPILLLAETGTGKELFANAVHRASPRSHGPFVAVNCGALSASLLESELFGYAPGAFTGARREGTEGKVAAAHGGTLFLDEVAELSPAAQAMLLRFLEGGTYSRLGETTVRRADVRIVCATCRDLPKRVREEQFREDLFFRIQGGCVRLPSLRARTDRVELAMRMLAEMAQTPLRLAPSAERWILDHGWPGNVRELKTALAHAVALCDDGTIERSHFPEPLLVKSPDALEMAPSRRTADRKLAEEALQRADGNVSEAARTLGVARSTLYRMLGK